ncbi:MAG: response regulator transcription factor [Hespellia sp.]|nr:response regulator transcription factor [Hespellia sp.]
MIVEVDDEVENLFEKICELLGAENYARTYNACLSSRLLFPKLEIDIDHHRVIRNEKIIHLTDQQFRILWYLAKNPSRVFTYEQIYKAVWNEEYFHEKGNVMSQIRHIRKKIEPDESYPHYIENVRGVGYRFNAGAGEK